MDLKTRLKRDTTITATVVAATLLLSLSAIADESTAKDSKKPESDKQSGLPSSFYVTPDYNKSTIDEVDKIVSKELYSAKLSKTVWPQALKDNRSEIVNSKNLQELSASVGKTVAALKSSHCQFATPNDETYHFLHALFGSFNKKLSLGKSDFTGFVTGTLGFADNQVRYVLDGSPAEKAGIRIGDKIESVNGNEYVGYSNFAGTSGAMQKLIIERDGKKINVNLKPEKVDFYSAYVEAMKKSARIIKEEDDDNWTIVAVKPDSKDSRAMNGSSKDASTKDALERDGSTKDASSKVASPKDAPQKDGDSKKTADTSSGQKAGTKQKKKRAKTIGYVHVWCGGSLSHEALDEIMDEKLGDTDGLIFDLRDGYGGNGLEDLDRFYRREDEYPIFKTVYRDGKSVNYKYYYDKPIVAIINNGSRSGKELLAFSLKTTGRAKLVGGTTAGAVLGGRLFPINDRASLYLAIFDGTIGGVRIEGVGVSPDVEVLNTDHSQAGADKQFRTALIVLGKMLNPEKDPNQPPLAYTGPISVNGAH